MIGELMLLWDCEDFHLLCICNVWRLCTHSNYVVCKLVDWIQISDLTISLTTRTTEINIADRNSIEFHYSHRMTDRCINTGYFKYYGLICISRMVCLVGCFWNLDMLSQNVAINTYVSECKCMFNVGLLFYLHFVINFCLFKRGLFI